MDLFEINRNCIYLTEDIVYYIHIQRNNTATAKILKLIKYLTQMLNYFDGKKEFEISQQKLTEILNIFLYAQENHDLVLIADILEQNLYLFLLELQEQNIADINILCNSEEDWEKNLMALKKINSDLYSTIERFDANNDKKHVSVFYAKNGQITMKYTRNNKTITMHSSLNPRKEAQEFIRSQFDGRRMEYCIWGLGMGYHVLELLNSSKKVNIMVLEPNISIVWFAFHFVDFSEWIENGRLDIKQNNSLLYLLQQIDNKRKLLIHYPSLCCLPDGQEKELLNNYFININSMEEQYWEMKDNFSILQTKGLPEGTNIFRKKVKGNNLVIIAAGPSLQDSLNDLKKYRKKIIILAVGRIAKNLIDYGIDPDFILISDSWFGMYHQIEKIENKKIPLLLLSTASETIIQYYKGPVYILYQKGWSEAEKYANERRYVLYNTGGSVTTLALDLALQSCPQKIILTGVDMAFPQNRRHAFDGETIVDDEGLQYVERVGGGKIITSRPLNIYREWMERRLRLDNKVMVYNVSKGAKIRGTIEKNFESIMQEE